jgi:hypothetical protein
MRGNAFSEDVIVQYLLGNLPEEEQVEIEDRAFQDKQYLQNLQDVENDLIDEYARGGLSDSERRQFEVRFLASEERRRKVKFALALASVAPEFAAEEKSAQTALAPAPVTWQSALATLLRCFSPAARFSFAAAALLIVAGGSWLIVESFRIRAELRASQQSQRDQQQALQQQLDDERTRNQDLSARLQEEQGQREHSEQALNEIERNQDLKAPSQPTIVSLALIAGIPRGDNARPKLMLRQSTRLAQLQIEIEPTDEYKRFRVELRTRTGQQVWTRDNLSARTMRRARAVILNLPASALRTGEYELTLKGVADGGTTENIGYYYFDVLKK